MRTTKIIGALLWAIVIVVLLRGLIPEKLSTLEEDVTSQEKESIVTENNTAPILPKPHKEKVRVKNIYYDIKGVTTKDLHLQMNQLGYTGIDGKINAYNFVWNISWNYGFRINRENQNCHIDWVEIEIELIYVMPKWITYKKGSPQLRKKWQSYIKSLKNHLNGHGEFGRKAGNRIGKEIAAMSSQESCSAMEKAINARGQKIINVFAIIEKEYDRITQHGITQGVVL